MRLVMFIVSKRHKTSKLQFQTCHHSFVPEGTDPDDWLEAYVLSQGDDRFTYLVDAIDWFEKGAGNGTA